MKTTDTLLIKADAVITEVRRAKIACAQKYDFDVAAMVRGLRERDEKETANKAVEATSDPPRS